MDPSFIGISLPVVYSGEVVPETGHMSLLTVCLSELCRPRRSLGSSVGRTSTIKANGFDVLSSLDTFFTQLKKTQKRVRVLLSKLLN